MLDFHTHILPNIDDGSASPEMSAAMLKKMYDSGIDTVFATPHYYADEMSIDEFLGKRAASLDALYKACGTKHIPKICPGAEVHITEALTSQRGLDRLCIEGTNLILIEPPYTMWPDSIFAYIEHILSNYCIVPVIAHIDRYVFNQEKQKIKRLFDAELLFQANAVSIINRSTRRKMLGLIKKGQVQFIGSDAHNLTTRPPNINEAYEIIQKKLSAKKFGEFMYYSDNVFNI